MGCLINPEVVIRGQEEGMERPSLVGHGVLRLPPGFRFHPTDEELVVQYLKRKAFSCPLPAFIIPEIDLRKYNPWDLPGGMNEERYFFSLREERYANGNRSNRATGSGYWKATGKDKMVVGNLHKQVVGMKKVLVFYQGKPQKGMKTDWIMHEYRLELTHSNKVPMREWVLCRIFMKKRVAKIDDHRPPSPSLSSASESSCVTEIFDGLDNQEETSSSP